MAMSVPEQLAEAIADGFNAMFSEFQAVTIGAKARFEHAAWPDVHEAMRERLTIYKQNTTKLKPICESIAGDDLFSDEVWGKVKQHFRDIIADNPNAMIGKTFFNSVFALILGHATIRDTRVFAGDDVFDLEFSQDQSILVEFSHGDSLPALVDDMFTHFEMAVPYEDKPRDVQRVTEKIEELLAQHYGSEPVKQLHVIESWFFRNKGAYLIGVIEREHDKVPFAIPFMNNESGGIYADTFILGTDNLSMIFSFTRSYFMVNAPVPAQYVQVLKELMPHKEIFELFTAIGFVKHGKTQFYRRAVNYTLSTPEKEKYVAAPGIKGMVMLVFTLPNFDYVYKVIKDRFTPPKDMTRKQVEEKYRLVKNSDRAGRMADVHEFRHLAFNKKRFSPELLEELNKECASVVKSYGNALVLKHVYVERKMTPLNLYLPKATPEQVYNAIDEYGNAIKQLAAVNIFPGDMLLKNFGVTRHGRVVFYDYDEICLITECNFRNIPKPRNEDEEYAQGAWFDVKPNDVFPEEFKLFFTGNPQAKEVFNQLHSDIYTVEFWQGMKDRIEGGEITDVFPYRKQWRFARPEGETPRNEVYR